MIVTRNRSGDRSARMTSRPLTTLYFDSDCPICSREAAWLKQRDKNDRLGLTDIKSITDADLPAGCTRDDLMSVLHARLPDGSVVTRLGAARAAYDAIGRGGMMRWTGWPIVSPVMEILYTLFARNRLRIGAFLGAARCRGDSCHVGPA